MPPSKHFGRLSYFNIDQQSVLLENQRSPPIGGTRRNAAPLNFKIAADTLDVINVDRASNRRWISLLYADRSSLIHSAFMQYSITFMQHTPIANSVTSDAFLRRIVLLDNGEKFVVQSCTIPEIFDVVRHGIIDASITTEWE